MFSCSSFYSADAARVKTEFVLINKGHGLVGCWETKMGDEIEINIEHGSICGLTPGINGCSWGEYLIPEYYYLQFFALKGKGTCSVKVSTKSNRQQIESRENL